jgi:putative membrane protein
MSHVADHLANERTFLAFVRTSVALISFGITLNRFSAFKIEEGKLEPETAHERLFLGDASRAGMGLALLGIALLVYSAVKATLANKAIDRGTYEPDHVSIWLVTGGVLLLSALGMLLMFRS